RPVRRAARRVGADMAGASGCGWRAAAPHCAAAVAGSHQIVGRIVRRRSAGYGCGMAPPDGIEVVRPDLPRGRFRAALFDFDGTLSLLREGWPAVMTRLMLEELRRTGTAEGDAELAALVEGIV